jgi:hypothetical protein
MAMKDAHKTVAVEEQRAVMDQGAPAGDLRRRRIADYLTEALRQDNSLRANLGAVNCDLMHLAYDLKQAIAEALGVDPALGHFQGLLPAIDYWLRVSKQVERLAQLDLQFDAAAADRAVKEKNKPDNEHEKRATHDHSREPPQRG